jgi:urease accessory protein
MLTCSEIRPAGTWNEGMAVDTVVLDFDRRHRRRHAMTAQAGLTFLLDLPRATALREGDGLVLRDGKIVRVKAARERLIDIAAPDLAALVRIAWHLGNRPLSMQVNGAHLYIRYDAVIMDMIRGLGGGVAELEAPFDPEGGAFTHEHAHRHA